MKRKCSSTIDQKHRILREILSTGFCKILNIWKPLNKASEPWIPTTLLNCSMVACHLAVMFEPGAIHMKKIISRNKTEKSPPVCVSTHLNPKAVLAARTFTSVNNNNNMCRRWQIRTQQPSTSDCSDGLFKEKTQIPNQQWKYTKNQ